MEYTFFSGRRLYFGSATKRNILTRHNEAHVAMHISSFSLFVINIQIQTDANKHIGREQQSSFCGID